MRIFAVAGWAALLVGCSPETVQVDAKTSDFLSMLDCPFVSGVYEPVTITELIARPADLDEKPVKISGYFISSFEHTAIYPTQQEPFSATFSEGLWTLLNTNSRVVSGQHVTLRGIYTTKIRGHGGQWPGSICVHSVATHDES